MYKFEDRAVFCTTCYASVGSVVVIRPTDETHAWPWFEPHWRPVQTPTYRTNPASRLSIPLAEKQSIEDAVEAIQACHAVECPAKEN